jgi:hypothetical protein
VTLFFLGLAIASALSRSASPAVLGRYSMASFAYQLLNVAVLALLMAPSRWSGLGQLGCSLAAGSTFLAPVNESIRHVPGIHVLLPVIRLLAGLALIAHEFGRYRAGRTPTRGVFLGIGAALVTLSAFDLALWGVVCARPDFEEDYEGYRDRYALEEITPEDIVVVGDSFVWGHGVRKDQRFGDVLQRLYEREGRRVRVFSLGVRGAGPDQYLESLSRVPESRKAGVVILSFYPNDLTPRPRPASKALRLAQRVTWPLGRSSLSFRAVHDLLGKIETPSIEEYHRGLVEDYRKDEPSFRDRWATLVGDLDRFAKRADRRSTSKPLLILIPLMVDYRDYPLAAAHEGTRSGGFSGFFHWFSGLFGGLFRFRNRNNRSVNGMSL